MSEPWTIAGIHPGEKFALIALPEIQIDAAEVPLSLEIEPGHWFSLVPPVTFDDQWTKWLGSIRAQVLSNPALFLFAKSPSSKPQVLDHEHRELELAAERMYLALIVSAPVFTGSAAMKVLGSNVNREIGIRQAGEFPRIYFVNGRPWKELKSADLRFAGEIHKALKGVPVGSHKRLIRVLNAFSAGIHEHDTRERLHQFSRCIEGLIFAEQGKTTSQFRSRTEVFVGTRHQDLMGDLYRIRSAIEHMNDPRLIGANDVERSAYFNELTLLAEDIARHALLRILRSPTLLACYQSEQTLEDFWKAPAAERAAAWGEPFDIDAALKSYITR